MKKQNIILTIFCVCVFLSCRNISNEIILGTWTPSNNRFGTNERMIFTKDGEILAQSVVDNNPKTERILKFRISDNGKVLIIDDKGKIEQLEIIELTESTMQLKNFKQSDTAKFAKQ